MIQVVCLKWGSKFSADWVNRLHNSVSRHLTLPHEFTCFTDCVEGLNAGIKIHHLPENKQITGWWWKLYLFKQGIFSDTDTVLFFDLDMVIVNNIDDLVTHLPNKFLGLRDVSRKFTPSQQKLGSAVMRWQANTHAYLWDDFVANPDTIKKFRGDQDWIWHKSHTCITFYPDIWIQSYKWEVRSRKELIRDGKQWVFATVRDPVIDPQTKVLAFHGTPCLDTCKDPVILKNWI